MEFQDCSCQPDSPNDDRSHIRMGEEDNHIVVAADTVVAVDVLVIVDFDENVHLTSHDQCLEHQKSL